MRVILTIILCSVFIPLQAQFAYIQVEAEQGISVFLDGSFKGKTTTDVGGLILDNVTPGTHSIKVLKDGFNPQEESVTVKPGEVYSYKVRPFIPRLKITETGNTGQQEIDLKVGRLKIQSLPVSINIIIPVLGVNYIKSKDEWQIEEVPVGIYHAVFKGMNKYIADTIEIRHNQLTHIFVNMVSGNIENRSPKSENYSGNASSTKTEYINNVGSYNDARDGITYKTIQIGSQIWMAENLRYNPGSGSWVYDDNIANESIYGRLYNWETAKEVCPSGWHLPSDAEWTELTDHLGGARIAGGKLKETKNEHWISPNIGATNESKFSGLPGGGRDYDGTYGYVEAGARWWSSSEYGTDSAWDRYIYSDGSNMNRGNSRKQSGFSVRCLRDNQ